MVTLKSTAIFCACLFLLVTLILNFTVRKSFFSESVRSIANTQRNIVHPTLTYVFNVISYIWKGKGMNAAFILYFLLRRKPRLIVFMGWITIKLYLVTLLKLILMDPRPFWAS